MMAPSRPNLSAFPNSPYAAELERGAAASTFSPAFEAEYVRAHLLRNRTLIRAACTFAMVLPGIRGVELLFAGWPGWLNAIGFAVILTTSIALAALTWSRAFEGRYLSAAQILVPLRNSLAAIYIAHASANGQLETLMPLSLMVVAPFFFLGLRFRVAMFSVTLTCGAFLIAALLFELPLPVIARSSTFLVIAATACAIAARHLETWSRTSFLESHLIAELAEHDALTGLKNRRVFDEHLGRLWQQAIEDGRAIAILLIDVDHFKAFNDRYGHQAGDQTLRQVAQTLQTFVSRPLDVVTRYGGEEFAVILYDIDADQVKVIANRMRLAVSELAIEHRESAVDAAVTISVGVAVIEPTRDRRSRGALQLADQALYEAKLQGRNRVELMDQTAYKDLETGVFEKYTVVH